jgi:hypothetical protein
MAGCPKSAEFRAAIPCLSFVIKHPFIELFFKERNEIERNCYFHLRVCHHKKMPMLLQTQNLMISFILNQLI